MYKDASLLPGGLYAVHTRYNWHLVTLLLLVDWLYDPVGYGMHMIRIAKEQY
jgi:hypothetical protein